MKSEIVFFSSLVRGTWAVLVDKSSEREENDHDAKLVKTRNGCLYRKM